MKKILFLVLLIPVILSGCKFLEFFGIKRDQASYNISYTNYWAAQKPVPPNPSFLVFAFNETSGDSWWTSELEDILISKGLPVISQPVISRKTTDYSRRRTFEELTGSGLPVDLANPKSSYVLVFETVYWSFRIIKSETHELVAKGYFSRSYKEELLIVLKDMGIPVELPPPGPPQKNFWQRLLWPEEKTP